MKNITVVFLFALCTVSAVSGNTLESVFPQFSPQQIASLEKSGERTRYFFTGESPEFLPQIPFSAAMNRALKKLHITMGVESVYFFKPGRDVPLLEIYNTLLNVSSMKGIMYYSPSRKRKRTLFTKSYVIHSTADSSPLPDPVVSRLYNIPSLYISQSDKTFGSNVYKASYRTWGKALWVSMVNETPMKYKFITMVHPEGISMNLVVIKTNTGLVFYGLTAAKTFSFLGLERTKKESFYYRIKALYNWFSSSIRNRKKEQ